MKATGNTPLSATDGVSLIAHEIAAALIPLLRDGLEVARDPKAVGSIQPLLLNIEQAARYLGRTVKGVRELERKGILRPVRLDRKLQFRRSDLDQAVERSTQ